ncbi:DUF2024 family protein [Aquimarina hainanensis]|uniref:DUF2024 family protein n=1 Tax=Aquimarina hainanensis TaxID=1578017 RepID=A0ABW5NA81_9FLAO|nr:DUF2024 family protein [Aquimarina sp. TRL1]QKX03675.1 DUF2024 family protein [Aquimarina sp. TRL1]
MKVSVYDTYVPKNKSVIMHFDILVEENTPVEKVYEYGKAYLSSKGVSDIGLTTSACRFCHIETAPEEIENHIKKNNFYIIEMENC